MDKSEDQLNLKNKWKQERINKNSQSLFITATFFNFITWKGALKLVQENAKIKELFLLFGSYLEYQALASYSNEGDLST